MLLETREDLIDDLAVLFESGRKYGDVVQVDCDLALDDEISKDGVHEGLECSRGVRQAKEHDQWFEKTLVGGKGSLPLISFFDSDIVVAPTNVEFGEVLGPFETVDNVRDEGEWVAVLDCALVQLPVVLHESKLPILLLDKEDW